MAEVLGIDIGGTGIKGAVVDVEQGVLVSDRHKLLTPKESTPSQIITVVKEMVAHFDWKDKPIGVGFPAVIMNGHSLTASNINDQWINYPIENFLRSELTEELVIINDADAAGMAEVIFGRGKDIKGTVLLLTLGTGIGSALFKDGKLLNNTELGHLKYKGKIAEKIVSNAARKRRDLSWEEYGKELNEFLTYIKSLFYPNLIILGGGISKRFDKYSEYLTSVDNVVPASQFNNAGIIGAALGYTQFK